MPDLGAYLSSINKTKQNLMRGSDDPKAVSDFPSFFVRRLLSYHADSIFDANEINCLPGLDNQLQYEYLLHALSVKNRFAKLHKAPTHEHVELVKAFYGYSDVKAMEVIDLHSNEDFERMAKHINKGGVMKK